MENQERPKPDQKWRRKTDHSKVLTVIWVNDCDYVHFNAPWMKAGRSARRPQSGCCLDIFYKRYECVTQ